MVLAHTLDLCLGCFSYPPEEEAMKPQGDIIAAHTGEPGGDLIEFLQLYIQRQHDDPSFKFRLDMQDRDTVALEIDEDEIEGKGEPEDLFVIVED
jgi:hypothetical protein